MNNNPVDAETIGQVDRRPYKAAMEMEDSFQTKMNRTMDDIEKQLKQAEAYMLEQLPLCLEEEGNLSVRPYYVGNYAQLSANLGRIRLMLKLCK